MKTQQSEMKIIKLFFSYVLIAAFGIYLWSRVEPEDKDHTFYRAYLSSLAIIGYLTIKWTDAEQSLRRLKEKGRSVE